MVDKDNILETWNKCQQYQDYYLGSIILRLFSWLKVKYDLEDINKDREES